MADTAETFSDWYKVYISTQNDEVVCNTFKKDFASVCLMRRAMQVATHLTPHTLRCSIQNQNQSITSRRKMLCS